MERKIEGFLYFIIKRNEYTLFNVYYLIELIKKKNLCFIFITWRLNFSRQCEN